MRLSVVRERKSIRNSKLDTRPQPEANPLHQRASAAHPAVFDIPKGAKENHSRHLHSRILGQVIGELPKPRAIPGPNRTSKVLMRRLMMHRRVNTRLRVRKRNT